MKPLKYKKIYLVAPANDEYPNLWVDDTGKVFICLEELATMGLNACVSTQDRANLNSLNTNDPEQVKETN